MVDPLTALGAAVAEAAFGYPRRLHHPVQWIGALIALLDRRWNRVELSPMARRTAGIAALAVVATAGLAGFLVQRVAMAVPFGVLIVMIVATVGLAQRSLHDHVQDVAAALREGDIGEARIRVARIVGRDTEGLDETGIAAAALESLAESFSDGVIAPLFWLVLGGLPGLFIYKAVNTADSMIGHMEPRWRDFGFAAARTDDLLNLVPARLAGTLIAVAAAAGFSTMLSDARKHASPNAGWPEAAMAGALGIRLGGPAPYDGVVHERPVFGNGGAPQGTDIARGLAIYRRACGLAWGLLLLGGLLWRL